MSVTAKNGKIQGVFTIPTGIPAGVKAVEIVGDQGSRATGFYTGRGQITIEERRRIRVLHRYDPLAQTFTLSRPRHIAAVGLFFAKVGQGAVTVQIRDTLTGLPTGDVLAEARIEAARIETDGETVVRFDYPPFFEAGHEYAVVVLTNDNTHALKIAEVGQYDAARGQYVTAQGYSAGVLLSSSNASTWTPHNGADLTFRLYAARFTETQKQIPLAQTAKPKKAASDYIVLANVERTAADTSAAFVVKSGSETLTLPENTGARLNQSEAAPLANFVQLQGTEYASPIVYAGAQAVSGSVATTADYVSRAIPASQSARVRVILETLEPQGASVKMSIGHDSAWEETTGKNGVPLGDGWVRKEYTANVSGTLAACKITLTGTPQARPAARNLRMFAE